MELYFYAIYLLLGSVTYYYLTKKQESTARKAGINFEINLAALAICFPLYWTFIYLQKCKQYISNKYSNKINCIEDKIRIELKEEDFMEDKERNLLAQFEKLEELEAKKLENSRALATKLDRYFFH